MKHFTKLLWLFLAIVGAFLPSVAEASKADVDKYLQDGGIFRIKNRGSNRYMTLNASNGNLTGRDIIGARPNALTQIWVVKGAAGTYSIRSAFDGRYVPAKDGNPMQAVRAVTPLYMKYSAANSGTSTSYVTISWKSDFSDRNCLNENNGSHNILGWYANSPSVNDAFSDWVLEPVNDLTAEEIKAQITSQAGVVSATDGGVYRILSASYNTFMSEAPFSHELSCTGLLENDYSQLWKLEKHTSGKWNLKNVLTGRYIKTQGGELSRIYETTTSSNSRFSLEDGGDDYLPVYSFVDGNGIGLHCDARGHVVGWDASIATSQWMLRTATVDETALKAAQDKLAEYAALTEQANVARLRTTMQAYFEDLACTKLKAQYQAMSDADLTTLMSTTPTDQTGAIKMALPPFVQEMVLKVKNDTWGHREKEFRIYDYKPYSDHTQWNSTKLVGTGYMLSPQTGPTGISVKRGDIITVYVGDNIPVGTTLHLMNCSGMEVAGDDKQLRSGLNVVFFDNDGHLFINYVITNTNKKLAEVPALPIHIEGGYVNGCFDITRGHTNADWLDMEKTLFKDEIIHMKSKWTQFNMVLSGVKKQINYAQMSKVDADGTPKGIEGTLIRWDKLVEIERELIGVPQFYDRFNSMLSASASSKGNPYASTYGTYYPGVGKYMNYDHMTFGTENDEGGDFWMVAHEVGHTNQSLINLPGDTEMSVNFFSQVVRWKQGSNVGRGRPLSNTIASFHKQQHHSEYDIWQRSRMYFQLWLYYELQGHKPGFWPAVCDLMRKSPMTKSTSENNPGSANGSYFKFAKNCADAAGEDLSEFFEFYGFFRPRQNFKVGDYTNSYFNITQADIDACKAYMSKYPKAHPGLIFIDERIRKSPANYPGMSAGAMRLGTSPDATPGVASEVGNVGMYSDFRTDLPVKPYSCTVAPSGRVTVKQDGNGAVGFKVYDLQDKLVYVANTWTFNLPSTVLKNGYRIVAAYGNGTQTTLYDSTNPTGIGTVEVTNSATPKVYDLTGRRTTPADHGVRIVNGKVAIQ